MTHPAWAVVFHAASVMDAQKARLRLEQAGIPVDLWDVNLNAMNPWLTFALGGVRVVVPRDREEEARRVLEATNALPIPDEELTRQALAAVPERAPRRHRLGWAQATGFFLAAFLFIMAFVFLYGLLR